MSNRLSIQQAGAALGVMASLTFVGLEIRQNTQIAQATAVLAISEQIIDWQTAASLDDDWIRILTFLETGGTYAELSPEDLRRYRWVVTSTIRITENRFRQMQLGIITEADLSVAGGRANVNWFRSPHFMSYWQSLDQSYRFAPDFVDFMETEILALR
jgi:hypothetical protein